MSKGLAVGIDLGATFSSIAVYRNGRAEIIPDKYGDRLIPSIVFYEPRCGRAYVGKTAAELALKCPGNCLKGIKRIIGRKFDDEFILRSTQLNTTAFSLTRGIDDKAAFQLNIGGRKAVKSPEEVTAEILRYLKQMATEYLGEGIKDAVVSVPAHFSNAQRKATKKAVELAGLKLLKFISEPCAAAANFLSDTNTNAKLLVFDWGGGKLDVSAIQFKNKTFEVKAISGDTLLGGIDLDESLFHYFYKCLSNRLKRRLLEGCNKLKEQLSFYPKFSVTLDCYDGINNLELTMNRSEFEDLTQGTFERATNMIELCLEDAGWNKSTVDELVLVGGSTRIPKIREALQSMFPGKKLRTDFNPDEAVVAGACQEAFWFNNHFNDKCKIIEVTPLSVGIACSGNLMHFFIQKNSPLPTKTSQVLRTSENYQKSIGFKVFEGERKNCLHNNKLGEFNIHGLPPKRVGDLSFTVTFSLDKDGLLTVTASENSTGKTNTLLVTMGELRFSSKKSYFSIEEAKRLRYEDDVFEEYVYVKDTLKKKCYRILYDLERITDDSDKDIVRERCQRFLEDSEKTAFTDAHVLMSKFKLFDEIVMPILKKHYLVKLTRYEEDV